MRQSTILLLASLFALFASASAGFLAGETVWIWSLFLGLGVLGLVTWFVMELVWIKDFLAKRTTHYGINALLTVLLVLVITVVVNLIAKEYDWKKDFTKNRFFTLSEQTENVVRGLREEVRIRAFVANPVGMGEFQRAFDRYTYLSPKLKFQFIDFEREPFAARRYDIKEQNTVVFETDRRQEKVVVNTDDPKFEEKVTNAIIAVTKGDKKTICMVTGHKEGVLEDSSPKGYSALRERLEIGRYKTQEVLLATEGVPAKCEILVMAGPMSDVTDAELTTLENYVKRGGKFFLMIEPDGTAKMKGFLAKFGVEWKPGQTVIEMDPRLQVKGGGLELPLVASYDTTSEITRRFKRQHTTIYAFPTVVQKAGTVPEGMTVTSLFQTSGASVEIPLARLMNLKGGLDVKGLPRGPISLAVTVTGKGEAVAAKDAKNDEKKDGKKDPEPPKDRNDAEFRLVVVGDAEFAANGLFQSHVNSDLFQNILSWLSKEEDLIAIRPKDVGASELRVSQFSSRFIAWMSVVIAPLSVWILGAVVWLRRRRK